MTPPDKCPKCASELRWPDSTYACKSFYLRTGEFIEDPLCLMTQRAKRAEAELEEKHQKILQLISERDRWRFEAEKKFAARREFEELLGMTSRPASDEAFQEALERLRKLVGEKKRGDEWKELAAIMCELTWVATDEKIQSIREDIQRLMKEENEGQAPLV